LRIIARGPEDAYFGPAFRRYTDVALESGDLAGVIERLEDRLVVEPEALPEDAQNELRYLRGRERFDAGAFDEAEAYFEAITRKSRFYANAQYLRGVTDVRAGELGAAEEHFCSIARTEDQKRYSFYVDERYFEIKDLAWLALGRVAHEGARSDDAFYYYFQVPQDSERVSSALFESAYAMYEGEDFDTAIDLLDQLEAHFPGSPYVDEATLLRGYVHLGRCEFERADELFQRFQKRFRPVVDEIDRIVASPARKGRLYEQLLEVERSALARERLESDEDEDDDAAREIEPIRTPMEMLLALLRVSPDFYRLHADVRTLDAEAARAGRLEAEIAALRARIEGGTGPRAAAERETWADPATDLRDEIDGAKAMLSGLTRQLDELRRAEGKADEVAAVESTLATIGRRIDELEKRLRDALAEHGGSSPEPEAEQDGLEALLARDQARARRLPGRVAKVRGDLVEAANAVALRSVKRLRDKLSGELRRSRIGRIDAVMGSKRRVEIQIESLAAGRFPPELQDPLLIQGLLRSDEEYWPFEGELWEDEFDEGVPPPEGG
jgi:tetratricopeptide (TPR) repeat protein